MNRPTLTQTLTRATAGLLTGAVLLMGVGASRASAAPLPGTAPDMPAPQDLTLTAIDGYTMRVAWRDPNNTEDGHYVAYREGPIDEDGDGKGGGMIFTPKVTGVNGTGAYTVRGLKAGTTYCFRVMARNDDSKAGVFHRSAFSESVCAATHGAPTTPTNLKAERDNFRSRILLTWSDVSDETYYSVTATSRQGNVPQRLTLAADPRAGANSTAYIVEGVNAVFVVGGLNFEVRACNPNGCSAPAKVSID